MCKIQIDGISVKMMIDSGASVILLDEATFRRMSKFGNHTLQPAHSKIYSYGSVTPLSVLGTFTASIKYSAVSTTTQLHVLKGTTENLLSYNTAQKLRLIMISVNTATVADKPDNSPESLKEEFKSLFEGVAKVRNKTIKS